ncbi:helix-turn-helix domain-containing protein [bacterium]|nr:helix-turn-helix domain-containing protein [bacterium]
MSEEKKSYYAIIPANVRYDKSITPNAKLLYGEITALCNEKGYCWASNNYFADLYEVTPQAVSKWINQLAKKGYITLDYERAGKEIKQRNIYIATYQQIIKEVSTKDDGGINKRLRGYQQKIKENNTSNNTSNNTYNIETPAKRASFQKPSLDDVKAYCIERKNKVDPAKFMSYYESNGWKVGRNPMKDWRAAVRTWEGNGYDQKPSYSKPLPIQTRTTFLDMED